jgi:ribosomal protein S18 acetylase RimI-like enzyme
VAGLTKGKDLQTLLKKAGAPQFMSDLSAAPGLAPYMFPPGLFQPSLNPWVPAGDSGSGSLGELLYLLAAAGVSTNDVLRASAGIDTSHFGSILQYLRAATQDGTNSSEKLLFHLELAFSIPPGQLGKWTRLVQEVRFRPVLSKEMKRLLESDIEDRLWDSMVARCGLDKGAAREPRPQQMAFLRGALAFLESWRSLLTADPNVGAVVQLVNRYGSIQAYYAEDERPRRTVHRLMELGYDTDYLVFGRQEILSVGANSPDDADTWSERLQMTIRMILGRRDEPPEVELDWDRRKVYHDIRLDLDAVREAGDMEAGLRIISLLLPYIEHGQATTLRNGDVVAESQLNQVLMELLAVRKLLLGIPSQSPAQRLVAIRSPKLVPELFFDNTRLSCCIFKPSGLFHGEICRLILDPATPIVEFWLEPYPEFLGLATFYAGVNGRSERTILMDTIDYNDRLHELRGYNGTMRFMLDSIVTDAHLARATKLLVFAAPWGKPLAFANFVKQMAPRSPSISYHESYYFEGADPPDEALADSLVGRHHYTEAFGYDRPLSGVIDYGYNAVGFGTIEKLLTGGRGVYEIDVAAYMADKPAAPELAKETASISLEDEALIYRPLPGHEREIELRLQAAIDDGLAKVSAKHPQARLEFVQTPDDTVLDRLVEIDAAAFGGGLRYERESFRERLLQKDAQFLVLRDGRPIVGFAFAYVIPSLSSNALFLDDLAIMPEYQSKGLGSILVETLIGVASVRGYSGIYVSAEFAPELRRFYERANFYLLGAAPGLGQVLYRGLSLTGPENAARLQSLLNDTERRCRDLLNNPRVTVHSGLDPALLQILQSLEATFPDERRYSSGMFRTRMSLPDAHFFLLCEHGEPIAYCLAFYHDALPVHAIELDSLSIKPEYQRVGIGRIMVETAFAIPTVTRYTTGVFQAQQINQDGVNLVTYYKHLGGIEVSRQGNEVRMVAPLHRKETRGALRRDGDRREARHSSAQLAIAAPTAGDRVTSDKAEGGLPAVEANGDGSIDRLPFVGKQIQARLNEIGIHDLADFLRRAGPKRERESLAAETGIREELLHPAAHFADIARAGVPLEYLGNLNHRRVRTLAALRSLPAEELRKCIPKAVATEELDRWQQNASQLQSLVEDQ